MIFKTVFFICAIWITCTTTITQKEAMSYLSYYGYMTESNRSDFRNCLVNFQKVVSVPMTGEMDTMTNMMMTVPRCGCSDKTKTMRVKRFSVQGSKWRVNRIKYNMECSDEIRDLLRTSLSRAFGEWSKYSKITFLESNPQEAHLHVSFGPMERSEIIAIAEYPIFGGNITFNKDIKWTDTMDSGANLYQIALHEIGHCLGFGHSMDKSSIMYPYYNKSVPKHNLIKDDIDGIKLLYKREDD